ncbi:hypothetical protein METBIDRAFT_11957 [Metschnikowia bicuspidata var. bicuspidata NRRL YB-4993]|uniref:BZIP domain-containing protein n=1 Tax=Metschnikowia bicuspidata var. bicuspidata NRRL YB-4993 TaxID=869754 RepID=A0A1A0HC38_9ASCO|nr:hypothetical protein METBIDRAFT_11957 [Metschnikowia bicuspidata var. bicuspidata NRRL YB-4993]OBA21442.1 hypothetical protein METBIDRAFT_11957 [Metschnikowia bicuspidata var. bicuspidata NRRL YB-4993]
MQETPAALIDQLVYFDNFLLNEDTPNLDLDAQVSLDLAAFADDSFVFAEEEKPDPGDLSDIDREDGNIDSHEDQRGQRHLEHAEAPLAGFEPPNEQAGASIQGRPGSGNLPFENQDPLSSSTSLGGPWVQQQKSRELSPPGNGEGKQLHSLLDSKIQTKKRNKLQQHAGHLAAPSSNHLPGPGPDFHQASESSPLRGGPLGPHNSHGDQGACNAHLLPAQHPGLGPRLDAGGGAGGVPDLTNLPKYPVPPGAQSSLKNAGLSQNQIDLLSALIAQHQTSLKTEPGLPRPRESSSRAQEENALSMLSAFIPGALSPGHSAVLSDLHGRGDPGLLDSGVAPSLQGSPASMYSSERSFSHVLATGNAAPKDPSQGNQSEGSAEPQVDKRKRNTAASARFRVKKKMKEKEMETKIQQLGDMIQKFEMRIGDLEIENRVLKNLIIEKGNRQSDEELRLLKDKARYVDRTQLHEAKEPE